MLSCRVRRQRPAADRIQYPVGRKEDGLVKRMNESMIGKLLIFLAAAVVCCAGMLPASAADNASSLLVTIWNVPSAQNDPTDVEFGRADISIQKERNGFIRGIQDAPGEVVINEITLSEQSSDLVRQLANLINNEEPLMVVGASGDLETMYCAMETEFFEVPMLIPYADGDIIPDSNQGFTIRMTPNVTKFTDYIGKTLLPASTFSWINTLLFEDRSVPDYSINIGVFFADNFNGHDFATRITQQLMDNGMDVEYYVPYADGELVQAFERNWTAAGKPVSDMDVILLIGFDQDPFLDLPAVLSLWEGVEEPPLFLMLGYVPDSGDEQIESAQNVLAIRQKLDMSKCPSDIVNHSEALGYAAGYITRYALEKAHILTEKEKTGWRLWFTSGDYKRRVHQTYLSNYRNNVRSAMIEMQIDVPCYGITSFSSQADDYTQLELVHYNAPDDASVIDEGRVFQYIYEKLQRRYR